MLNIFGEATSPLKNKNSETCLNMDNHPGIKDFLDGFHGEMAGTTSCQAQRFWRKDQRQTY